MVENIGEGGGGGIHSAPKPHGFCHIHKVSPKERILQFYFMLLPFDVAQRINALH